MKSLWERELAKIEGGEEVYRLDHKCVPQCKGVNKPIREQALTAWADLSRLEMLLVQVGHLPFISEVRQTQALLVDIVRAFQGEE